MADTFDAGKYGSIVALTFGVANAVTAKTNTDLAVADASGNTLSAPMPNSGSVVGVSASASAAVTAGTVSFAPHSASTEFAQVGFPNPGLNSTVGTDTSSYASIRPGVCTFSAGARLGVSYTSSTDAAPTDTNDYTVTLFVQIDPV